jgi:hypothetical protein
MIFFRFFLISLIVVGCGFADQESSKFSILEEKSPAFLEDEAEVLDQLIAANEKRLATQKVLRDLMVEFKQQKDEFFLGNQTKRHAFAMVSNARQILGIIKQEHLSYLFSPEYLEELVFFSSIAGKSAPVRP